MTFSATAAGAAGINYTVKLLAVEQTALMKTKGLDSMQNTQKPEVSFNEQTGTGNWENANYKITFDEKASQIFVQNKNTGENYTVWGDPHVSIGHEDKNTGAIRSLNGDHDFDFKKDVRMTLEDGTELHIKTTPWERNGKPVNGMTLASQVMIQDGLSDHAFKITGLDQNKLGDTKAEELTDLQLNPDDRINPGIGLQMLERAGSDKGFSLADENGQFHAMDDKHRANTSEITAMENFLAQHGVPVQDTDFQMSINQQAIAAQLQEFMQSAMAMFTQQQAQIPEGATVFQQISTTIQGQSHFLGITDQ